MARTRSLLSVGSVVMFLLAACGEDAGETAGGGGGAVASGGSGNQGGSDSGSGGSPSTGGSNTDGSAGESAAPSCNDGKKNGNESDVDCGGVCDKCGDGKSCSDAIDCASFVCESGSCKAAECGDGVKNGDETDKDCGQSCPKCSVCLACKADGDCAPGLCEAGLCGPTIEVVSAVYAGNCGAPTPVPKIVTACNGKKKCDYVFNYTVDVGYDPAYGCYKDLKVEYKCTGGTTTKTYYESCAPCDPQNTPTQIHLALECKSCVGLGVPPP